MMSPRSIVLLAGVLGWSAPLALGQDAPPADDPAPATTPADTPPDEDRPKTLDELLGLDEGDESGADAAGEAAAGELERALEEEPDPRDSFVDAIGLMEFVSTRLEDELDTGIGTQRAQQEVMDRLQELLDSAKKSEKNQSSSSSSSSSSQSQSQSQSDPGKQRGESQGEQGDQSQNSESQQGGAQQGDEQDGEGTTQRPAGDLNAQLDEDDEEWGALPQRIRDMVVQGRRDYVAPLYKRLTDEYYRRLAEND